MANFLKIFGGIALAGIGVAVTASSTNNTWEFIFGVILIAAGIAILFKD